MTPSPSPPVPKPRTRYSRASLSSCDGRDVTDENLQPVVSDEVHPVTDEGAPPGTRPSGSDHGAFFPTLTGVCDIIATKIPSLAGVTATIRGSTPIGLPAAPSTHSPGPERSGMVHTAVSPTPPHPPRSDGKPPMTADTGDHTDVEMLSQLVMSALNQTAGVTFPPTDVAAGHTDKDLTPSPHNVNRENPYVTMLSCWDAEEVDTESSNEEEDTGGSDPPDPALNLTTDNIKIPASPPGPIKPTRPAPPPPHRQDKPERPGRLKQKTPRAATIRVSRKKGANRSSTPQSAVVRCSWLDVWKGFRHNVLWATLDGQQVSLWKKRTDQFSEVLFHVSSITNVKKQDKGRFSVYFRKKHYDFMAHSEEVQDGWVTSLQASRGQPSPSPAKLHGQITIKDPRSRAYAAVWDHNLWIYPSKEGYQLGIASFSVPLNVATVKSTGKHSFALITPYKSFNISVDSSKDLSLWLDSLSSSISSALSCSHVTMRLLENPNNSVCGDCGAMSPEWASVNLLLVICQACAGQHRALGSNLSKVRSLKMDNKVWTEPLIQLFVSYGNRLANQVWAATVPAAEQLLSESSDEERSKFIQNKYSRGRYRRVHPLTSSPSQMDQRLREVVCTDNIEETMFLICSGAKVHQSDLWSHAPILLAESAGQALQTELLRLNEYTEVPAHQPQLVHRRRSDSATSSDEEEELHGKLEEDRFLFSVENDSATCDVLDLRDVLSVFVKDGATHEFEVVTLNDQLICAADDKETLQTHLLHILKVILPGGVSYAEVCGAVAVSKVCVLDAGEASSQPSAWLILWDDGVSIYPVHRQSQQPVRTELTAVCHHEMDPSENIITMETRDRKLSLYFEEQLSCRSWFIHLQKALTNHNTDPHHSAAANEKSPHQPLYPVLDLGSRGSVPPGVERCISHITAHGLKVEGVYRRCGLASKVSRLVEALMTSPSSAHLECDEQGVLDAASALKQYVRQWEGLISNIQPWLQAAVISDEHSRFKAYQQLLWQLPDNNRATLHALFAHFYSVQMFSQVNKMSAQNLALVLVPSLFHTLNQDLLRLTREFIIHHKLLFLMSKEEEEEEEEEEQITVF